MPRIPVRVEPYNSPSKQHRHYKSKRDQILRALGKAAYINGSQFALLLVSARGDVETYASEALQGRLDSWFVKSGIANEARELAKGGYEERPRPSLGSLGVDDLLGSRMDDLQESSTSASPAKMNDDPFLDSWNTMTVSTPKSLESQNWTAAMKKDMVTDDANSCLYERGSASDICSPPVARVPQMSTPLHPSASRRNSQYSSRVASQALQAQYTIELKDEASRTAFMELRFSQLQQIMCKMVAKEWIKVIEPKKQTRFPYNKGEAGKPAWWPEDVRHKEPDHLMKPERHALLLAILRSSQTRIARLQLATAEVSALIKAGKGSYLMDVYRVAREEEKLRDEGRDMNSPVTVGVSSLEGWDAMAGCVAASGSQAHAMESDTSLQDGREAKGKRRMTSRTDEEDQADLSISSTWTSSGHEVSSPHRAVLSSAAPAPVPSSLNMQLRSVDTSGSHVVTNSPYDASPDLFSPALPSTSSNPARSHTMDTPSTIPMSMVQSPAASHAPLQGSYVSGVAEPSPRSTSMSHPVQSVPMRPTRSTPAQVATTPDNWAMRQAQSNLPGIHLEGPISGSPMSTEGPRMAWGMPPQTHSLSSSYPRAGDNGNVPPSHWPMPETPVQRPSHSSGMPMNFGFCVSPSGDVRFSSSFDASFSSSHHGPVTPAHLGHMNMPGTAMPPGMSPQGNGGSLGFHDTATAHPPTHPMDMHGFPSKTHPPTNMPFHPMPDWPTH
ncbi:hypothetical protein ACI68E_002157 [Malassezia pachydermatis]